MHGARVAALRTLPAAGKIVFLRPFKGRKKAQTVWDAVWIDAASECFLLFTRQQRRRRQRRQRQQRRRRQQRWRQQRRRRQQR